VVQQLSVYKFIEQQKKMICEFWTLISNQHQRLIDYKHQPIKMHAKIRSNLHRAFILDWPQMREYSLFCFLLESFFPRSFLLQLLQKSA